MNSRRRWREVLQVCHRQEIVRPLAPPDWAEWGYCPDCAAATGQACYDVLGSTTAFRATDRMGPHPSRVYRQPDPEPPTFDHWPEEFEMDGEPQ